MGYATDIRQKQTADQAQVRETIEKVELFASARFSTYPQ
jgi:hypothetical protein